jgi:hypothetical protein
LEKLAVNSYGDGGTISTNVFDSHRNDDMSNASSTNPSSINSRDKDNPPHAIISINDETPSLTTTLTSISGDVDSIMDIVKRDPKLASTIRDLLNKELKPADNRSGKD